MTDLKVTSDVNDPWNETPEDTRTIRTVRFSGKRKQAKIRVFEDSFLAIEMAVEPERGERHDWELHKIFSISQNQGKAREDILERIKDLFPLFEILVRNLPPLGQKIDYTKVLFDVYQALKDQDKAGESRAEDYLNDLWNGEDEHTLQAKKDALPVCLECDLPQHDEIDDKADYCQCQGVDMRKEHGTY
ncbi:hypothetical protein [Caudoviricetes sp.]|nr:hypothetical protein [Caudoviricetes sp.]